MRDSLNCLPREASGTDLRGRRHRKSAVLDSGPVCRCLPVPLFILFFSSATYVALSFFSHCEAFLALQRNPTPDNSHLQPHSNLQSPTQHLPLRRWGIDRFLIDSVEVPIVQTNRCDRRWRCFRLLQALIRIRGYHSHHCSMIRRGVSRFRSLTHLVTYCARQVLPSHELVWQDC